MLSKDYTRATFNTENFNHANRYEEVDKFVVAVAGVTKSLKSICPQPAMILNTQCMPTDKIAFNKLIKYRMIGSKTWCNIIIKAKPSLKVYGYQ